MTPKLPPVRVTRRDRRTYRPELVLAPGPAQLAQPGGGTNAELYGCPWALALHRSGPQLYHLSAGVWAPRSDLDALAPLAQLPDVRHVGLAFDQAARPVICWEQSGAVVVRQWNAQAAQYVTRGPWAGCDPVIYADSAAHYRPSDSDVVLWYLTPDRRTLAHRVQRDLYAVERAAHTYAAPVVLDQIVAHPYRAQLLAADLSSGAAQPVTVGLYPIFTTDATTAQAAPPTGGVLFEVVIVRSGTDAATVQAAPPTGGVLFEAVIVRSGTDAATVQTAPPTGGALVLAVVVVTLPPNSLSLGVSAPTGGTLA